MMGRAPLRHRDGDRFAIDRQTADRLLRGALAPADAPPGYQPVSEALRGAAGPATAAELDGRAAAVDTIVTEISAEQRKRPPAAVVPTRRITARRVKVVAATTVAMLSVTTGMAMAGALPDGAQRFVASVLAQVGVSAPTPRPPHRAGSGSPGSSDTRSVRHLTPASGSNDPTPSTTPSTTMSGPGGGSTPGAPGGGTNPGSPPAGAPGRSDQHGNPSPPGNPGGGSNRGGNGNGNANGNGASHANSPNGVARGHP
jgi:hypothetical protein